MALDTVVLQLLLLGATMPIFLASAAFFGFAQPATPASRLLATFLLLLTGRSLATFMELFSGTPPGDLPVWSAFGTSMNLLAFAVFLVLFWHYPAPLSLRTWHGRAYAAMLALYVAYVLAWLGARELLVVDGRGTWLYSVASRGMNVVLTLAGISALIRARRASVSQRRAASILVPVLLLTTVREVGTAAWGVPADLLGGAAYYDPRALMLTLEAASTVLNLGLVAYLTFWERSYAALLLVGYGFVRMLLGAVAGVDISVFGLFLTLRAVVPVYLASRYGLFGLPAPAGPAARVLPLATMTLVFLMVNVSIMSLFGDSALAIVMGVFVGLAAGIVAAIAVGPAQLTRLTTGIMGSPLRPPLPGQAQANALDGRFQMTRVLGEGAQGTTHLCRDLTLQRDVVVKRIAGGAGGRALREARVVARLRHPNIVAIHDILEDDRDGYIVMEHADGGNLRHRMPRGGGLAAGEAKRIADEVLSALEACHAEGVVHCDIKPENILFDARGNVKLIDFGIARDPRAARTIGVNAGTLHYMSPEQVRGEKPDARSDVFSTGVVLHEMLTGKLHLSRPRASDFDVRSQIVSGDWTRERPEGDLGNVVHVAIAPDPRERFANAAAMREALHAAIVAAARQTV